jgi:hypothetical protein
VIGQVASANGYEAFLVNQSAAAQTLTINGHAVTLAPTTLAVLPEPGPLHVASALAAPSYTQSRPLPSYVPAPTVTQPPSTVYPGETVTLTGEGFGTAPGFVTLGQGSVSYGAPGDAYAVRITRWSATTVSFVVPNGYSGPGLTPGTAATLQIASRSGVLSPPYTVAVTAPPVLPITALQPNPVAPGQWVTLTGDGFGSAQGSGYVWIRQNGVNWGAPGNAYPVAIQRWTNTSITFLAPTNAYAVDGHWEAALQPGSATVTVVSGAGGQSAPTPFAVNAPS